MPSLRSVETIALEERVPRLFLVAAARDWEYFHPVKCPKPILDWLVANCPTATIEPVRLDGYYSCFWEHGASASFQTSDEIPRPIFRLRFTDEQAQAFEAAWSDPARQPADGKDDFYLIEFPSRFLVGLREFDELPSSMDVADEAVEMARQ